MAFNRTGENLETMVQQEVEEAVDALPVPQFEGPVFEEGPTTDEEGDNDNQTENNI